MKTNIDIKSAVLGLAIGIAATLGIGAMASGPGPMGRYQIAGAPGHGLVIDIAESLRKLTFGKVLASGRPMGRFYGRKPLTTWPRRRSS